MSVQSPSYIVWGIKLPVPEDIDDREDVIEKYRDSAYVVESVNKADDVTFLMDMDGEWMVIGHVLARTGPYGNDPGFSFTTIPTFAEVGVGMGIGSIDHQAVLNFAKWKAGIEKVMLALGCDPNDPEIVGSTLEWHVFTLYR